MKRAFINAELVNGNGGLLIDGDKIVASGKDVTAANVSGAEVRDCKGKMLLAGLIDMRVFTGEPGSEYRETLASASEAAA